MDLTQLQIDTMKLPIRNKYIRLEILDSNFSVIDRIESECISGELNKSAKDTLRRSGSVTIAIPTLLQASAILNRLSGYTISVGGKIWIDKAISVSVGIKNYLQDNTIVWYKFGVCLIDSPQRVFSASQYALSFNLIDYLAVLSSDRYGQLTSQQVAIDKGKYEIDSSGNTVYVRTELYGALRSVLQDLATSLPKFTIYPIPTRCQYLPFDLKFSTGETVMGIIDKFMEILSTWQYYLDEDGVLTIEPIPSGEETPVLPFDETTISEFKTAVDFKNVKNQVVVYGRTNDPNYFVNAQSSTPMRRYVSQYATMRNAPIVYTADYTYVYIAHDERLYVYRNEDFTLTKIITTPFGSTPVVLQPVQTAQYDGNNYIFFGLADSPYNYIYNIEQDKFDNDYDTINKQVIYAWNGSVLWYDSSNNEYAWRNINSGRTKTVALIMAPDATYMTAQKKYVAFVPESGGMVLFDMDAGEYVADSQGTPKRYTAVDRTNYYAVFINTALTKIVKLTTQDNYLYSSLVDVVSGAETTSVNTGVPRGYTLKSITAYDDIVFVGEKQMILLDVEGNKISNRYAFSDPQYKFFAYKSTYLNLLPYTNNGCVYTTIASTDNNAIYLIPVLLEGVREGEHTLTLTIDRLDTDNLQPNATLIGFVSNLGYVDSPYTKVRFIKNGEYIYYLDDNNNKVYDFELHFFQDIIPYEQYATQGIIGYSATTAYTKGDIVNLDGTVYQALSDTTGNAPIDVRYWEPVLWKLDANIAYAIRVKTVDIDSITQKSQVNKNLTFELIGKQVSSATLIDDTLESPYYINTQIKEINYFGGRGVFVADNQPYTYNGRNTIKLYINDYMNVITELQDKTIITFYLESPAIYPQGSIYIVLRNSQMARIAGGNSGLLVDSTGTNIEVGKLFIDGTIMQLRYDKANDRFIYLGRYPYPLTLVKSGGEFDNIYSDRLAYERCVYELFTHTNLNNNISISCVPNYYLDVNQKIEVSADAELPLWLRDTLYFAPQNSEKTDHEYLVGREDKYFTVGSGANGVATNKKRYLIKSITYPLGVADNTQTINAIEIYDYGNLMGSDYK